MLKLRNAIRVSLVQWCPGSLLTRPARSTVVVSVSLPLLTVAAGYVSLRSVNAVLTRVSTSGTTVLGFAR